MAKIKCKLIASSNSIFLQQIYTGFFILYKNGLIDLEQVIIKKNDQYFRERPQRNMHIRVILNDNINLFYDTSDGHKIHINDLNESQYYFKRSYFPKYIKSLGEKKKVLPFGLNYAVFPNNYDKFAIKRNFTFSKGVRKVAHLLYTVDLKNRLGFAPRINLMHALPDYSAKPKIIFMVKAFNPYDYTERPKHEIEERMQINATRAMCIKMLKQEFGKNFYGGFYHNSFTIKNYSELLIPDKSNSTKKKYINLIRNYPICVANSGVHGSIGWKFAEYIAFSKAIIAEKMKYEVPNIKKGKNFLEFSTPEGCVENTTKLFYNEDLRHYLMLNNAKYYNAYLSPDSLILNTLFTALNRQFEIS
jgi:hypothetical protein